MATDTEILASLGLERLIEDEGFNRAPDGTMTDPNGTRIIFAQAEFVRGLYHVLENEKPGAWRTVMKISGHDCGRKIAVRLDSKLAAIGQPLLASLPLEGCLVFLERYFAVHGWGRLKLDLSAAADHGLVVASVQNSCLAESLSGIKDFVDPVLAGMLQGFFEHISGQVLASEEIGCMRRGASECTFVITSPERLAPVLPLLGSEPADALLARLKA
jgi:predicted hydrocarbon binding protein